jgi:hypothetical protein
VNGSLPGAAVPNRIENNTIVGNSATGSGGSGAGGKGGGMLAAFSATINSRNNIVWSNTQSIGGPLNIASGSVFNVAYSDVEGGATGVGNINLNPQFSDTSFYLQPTSPCVDAGDTSAAFNDPPNPSIPSQALWPSRGGLRNDIGAYGGPFRKLLGTILTSVAERVNDVVPTGFSLEQNYPNPFNPTTNFGFRIANFGFVSLKVFDVLGKEVATVVNENRETGNYKIAYDGSTLPSGVYFYRLTANGFSETKRMVLIR